MKKAVEVGEQIIDDLNLEIGLVPESEEGKHKYR
jgi:hypothetical protein